MDKLKMSMKEIAAATGESMPVLYAAIRAGDLETFLVGRRRYALTSGVEAWVHFLKQQSDAGSPVTYLPRQKGAA